ALSRALNGSLALHDDNSTAAAYRNVDQVSLAARGGGPGNTLAGKRTGYQIAVYSEADDEEEHVGIAVNAVGLGSCNIDELKRVGLDTAEAVLPLSVDGLVQSTGSEENTIHEIIQVLQPEFE